jgi:hypothetical protein
LIAENWPAILMIAVVLVGLFAIAMAAAMYFGNDM